MVFIMLTEFPVLALFSGGHGEEILTSLFIIFVAAKIFAEIFERLKQPAVVGEILAGVLIGPSVLGLVRQSEVTAALAEIGVILLLFTVGLEVNPKVIFKVGKNALMVALLGVIVPFSLAGHKWLRYLMPVFPAFAILAALALVAEELELKNARWARVPAHRRPHYSPVQRMRILELRAARGWSTRQTAERFLVTEETIASWMGRLDEEGFLFITGGRLDRGARQSGRAEVLERLRRRDVLRFGRKLYPDLLERRDIPLVVRPSPHRLVPDHEAQFRSLIEIAELLQSRDGQRADADDPVAHVVDDPRFQAVDADERHPADDQSRQPGPRLRSRLHGQHGAQGEARSGALELVRLWRHERHRRFQTLALTAAGSVST